jgi:hypothetical protein
MTYRIISFSKKISVFFKMIFSVENSKIIFEYVDGMPALDGMAALDGVSALDGMAALDGVSAFDGMSALDGMSSLNDKKIPPGIPCFTEPQRGEKKVLTDEVLTDAPPLLLKNHYIFFYFLQFYTFVPL